QSQSIRGTRFKKVCEVAKENGCLEKMLKVGIDLYGASDGFNAADERFDDLIRPYLSEFSPHLLLLLLAKIEGNSQTYDRRKANTDHRHVKELVDRVLKDEFHPETYPRFCESIGLKMQ